MKNIYEDGNDRSNMEDIGSGSAPLSDDANAKPNHLPPQNSDSLFVKAAQNSPPANSQPTNPGAAAPNLTPEQIAALFGQFLTQMSANNPPAAATQAVPNNGEPVSPVQPQQPNNTGKRILYQSEDFDEKGTPERAERFLLDEGDREEARKKSFYDDDELFDAENQTVIQTPSSVKMTDFGDSFSIAEVDIDSDNLPSLPDQKTKPQTPPVVRHGTTGPSRTPSGSAFAPPIRQSGGQRGPSNPIYPTQPQVVRPSYAQAVNTDLYNRASFTSTDVDENETPAKKKKKPSDIIRIVVLTISLIAIVVASGVLIREYKLHKDNEKLEADISNLIIDEPESTTKKKTEKTTKKNSSEKTTKAATTAAPTTTKTLTPEEQWAQIKAEYPNVVFPENLQLKYAKLYATNQEFVGYLSAEGIGLSLPVVQTTDDEKYLKKNFYGQNTKYGCPFVTHLNNIETLDMNTVIFGHHMNDGTVFGALDKYKTIDGFKKAPVITFNTLYKNYKWKVIAAFITNADEKDDNGFVFRYYFTSLSTEERYAAYLNELAQRSLYDTGVDVLPSDKILTLSTCSHEFDDARFVVVARLLRTGESEDVDVSRASVNSNPRYPQAYYDKKKQKNPYANASQWQVG
ncbi:MAG: sortase domain-bontaining protein [Acutalibacteraceae bacterium]